MIRPEARGEPPDTEATALRPDRHDDIIGMPGPRASTDTALRGPGPRSTPPLDTGPAREGPPLNLKYDPSSEDEPGHGRHGRPPEKQATYREVFAIREFRGVWFAQVLSYAGDQFAQVAIAVLVYHRTGSALLTALAYALTYLPPIAGGPLLSGLADLFPRRRVMIACDLIRAGLVSLMAIPSLPFAGLCGLLFFTVLLGAPFTSARSALLPDILRGDKFVVGSAIGNISFQASQVVGFVAGAAVVAVLDPYRTLATDAVTFLLSAVIVTGWVRRRDAPEREPGQRSSLWAVSRDGMAMVFGDPVLRTLVLFGWLAGFCIVPESLAAPYAHSLHGDALTVGASAPPLPVVLALWVLAGAGEAYQLAAAAAFVQSLTPSGRGRAFGLAQSGLLAVQGLGILAGGAVANAVGAPVAVGLAGMLGLAAAAILAMSWTLRRGAVMAAARAHAADD